MEGELQPAQLHTWPSEDRSGFKVVLFEHNSLSIKFINKKCTVHQEEHFPRP